MKITITIETDGDSAPRVEVHSAEQTGATGEQAAPAGAIDAGAAPAEVGAALARAMAAPDAAAAPAPATAAAGQALDAGPAPRLDELLGPGRVPPGG
jgi:hypothetical protein